MIDSDNYSDWGGGNSGYGSTGMGSMFTQTAQPSTPAKPNVSDWYHQYLGRDGDAAGMAFWQKAIDGGMDANTVKGMFEQQAGVEKANKPTNSSVPYGSTNVSINPANNYPTAFNGQQLNSYQQQVKAELDKLLAAKPSDLSSNGFLTQTGGAANGWMMTDPTYAGLVEESKFDYNPGIEAQIAKRAQELQALRDKGGNNAIMDEGYKNQLSQAQSAFQYALDHPEGPQGGAANFMGIAIPALVGGLVGGGLLGAYDGAAGLGAGASGSSGAAGTVASGSGGLGAVGGSGATAGIGSGVAEAGLGGIIGGNIPQVVITGAAGGAGAGGIGAGTIAAGAAGLGGLGAIAAGGGGSAPVSSTIPNENMIGTETNPAVVHVTPPTAPVTNWLENLFPVAAGAGAASTVLGADQLSKPPTNDNSVGAIPPVTGGSGGVHIPESSLPPLVMPGANPMDPISDSDVTGGKPGGGINLPGGLGSIKPSDVLGAIGAIGGGIKDYTMNRDDMKYYQDLIDKMMGMYAPGSAEAEMMRHKLEAKDAAAGRNSQYGIREQNLAAMLAEQRSKIMTSPVFSQLAQASRGHYDNSLSSLFNLLGNGAGGSSGGGAAGNLIDKLWGAGSSFLSGLFK